MPIVKASFNPAITSSFVNEALVELPSVDVKASSNRSNISHCVKSKSDDSPKIIPNFFISIVSLYLSNLIISVSLAKRIPRFKLERS
jgi:hypothetical protein